MIALQKNWSRVRLNPMQNLLTAAQQRQLPPLYAQDGKGMQAKAYVKFFCGATTWFATEFDAETGDFFGYVHNAARPQDSELGYFSAQELCQPATCEVLVNGVARRMTLRVERDLHFKPKTLDAAIRELERGE